MSGQQLATYIQDLEQDPFDPTGFVEKLAWRHTEGEDTIEPSELHKWFEEQIFHLQCLSDNYENRMATLKNQTRDGEEKLTNTLEHLQLDNNNALEAIKSFEERMSLVATRVVHLGEQLENINVPRQRTKEALELMQYFDEFNKVQPLSSEVFSDPERLIESASIIQKLQSVSSELSDAKYKSVKCRIEYKYDEIENFMIEEFKKTLRNSDKEKMHEIIAVLSHFRGYSRCIDEFVETIQIAAFRSNDLFEDIATLCHRTSPLIEQVFPNPDQVRSKLLLNLFHGRLLDHVETRIGADARIDDEEWLTTLYDLYCKTIKLADRVIKKKQDDDEIPSALDDSTINARRLFGRYLEEYELKEMKYLKRHCSSILSKFYQRKQHQKKKDFTAMSDLRRDLQARVFSQDIGNDETLLSDEIAISMLQEAKNALARSQMLCEPSKAPYMAKQILQIIITYLCVEHIEYAVDTGRSVIPIGDLKSRPPTQFLKVVQQAVGMCHLVEKAADRVADIVRCTTLADSSREIRNNALLSIEGKISSGVDRQIYAMTNYVKYLLNSDKKLPEYAHMSDNSDEANLAMNIKGTPACALICEYLSAMYDYIRASLDGGNLTSALHELGTRVHRAIIDHIYQFQYTTTGAVLLLCDVKEYRATVQKWHAPIVTQIFDALHSLCVLLTVKPEYLTETSQSDVLGGIDYTVIVTFVQLRADYKTAKLFNDFR